MTHVQTILVPEEHPAMRNFLIDNLAADGYRTLAADDRAKALALLDVEHRAARRLRTAGSGLV